MADWDVFIVCLFASQTQQKPRNSNRARRRNREIATFALLLSDVKFKFLNYYAQVLRYLYEKNGN